MSHYLGIEEFPADWYRPRNVIDECDLCGAKPGFCCFEIRLLPGKLNSCSIPVSPHMNAIAPRPSDGEIPVEHQALSSGALKVL